MIEAVSHKIQVPWFHPRPGVAVVADATHTWEPVFAPAYRWSNSCGLSYAASNYLDDGGGDNIVKHAFVIGYVDSFFYAPDLLPPQYAAVWQPILQGVCPRHNAFNNLRLSPTWGERLMRLFETFEISQACACLAFCSFFIGWMEKSRHARDGSRVNDHRRLWCDFMFILVLCWLVFVRLMYFVGFINKVKSLLNKLSYVDWFRNQCGPLFQPQIFRPNGLNTFSV